MKKYLKFLTAVVLIFSIVVISACSDDEGGKAGDIPADPIKSLKINNVTWEFEYDTQERLTLVTVTEEGDPGDEPYVYRYEYDYSVAGQVSETEAADWGEYTIVFKLDAEGRIERQLTDNASVFEGFEYDDDGYLVRWYSSNNGVQKNKWTATVSNGNVMVHTLYKDDGVTVNYTKSFTYLTPASAKNVSNLPQSNLRNSERRTVSGLYGTGSVKLVDFLEINNPTVPADYRKNRNIYSFDDKNRVVTITRKFADAAGNQTSPDEVFEYTYYDVEE